MNAPVLDTPRLTLRPPRADDFDGCLAMWCDPLVSRYLGGRPLGAEEVWSKILRYAGHWALLGYGYWIVRDRASQRFVGEVGFGDMRRTMSPSLGLEGVPEIGWALATWAQGRGLATEAVKAVIGWGDVHFGGRRTVCLVDPENRRSLRLAEKCGYAEMTRATYKGEPTVVLARDPGAAQPPS